MGVFDFVREAGAKVGIGDSKEEREEKEASASSEQAEAVKKKRAEQTKKDATNRSERLAENRKAAGLEMYVKKLGLEVADLDVRYDDGKAEVSGTVADQATRERVILALGNVEGVATVDDEIKVDTDSAESDMHVVVSGDTLSKIAKDVYGDASKYPVIFEANKPMLKDPDKIYVGQVLRIPALDNA